MKKLMAVLATVITFSTSVAAEVLADGYPTGQHTPVDTGLEDISLFYILSVVAFVLGMGVLSGVKVLKMRAIK